MKAALYLVKRNILIFIRDRGTVISSILSMLITLGLMFLFLGDMHSRDIIYALEQFGGNRDAAADSANAEYLISMWTLAGILLSNTVTVTMTAMGSIIEDEVSMRLASLYVTPVKRIGIAFGYVFSAWSIAVSMCMITLAASQVWLAAAGQTLLGWEACLQLLGMIMLNAFAYAATAYLLTLFVHSVGAWNGLLTIVGTLVGFVGAIYLPVSVLPETVADILRRLPFLHGAAMMRVVCTKEAVEKTFAGIPAEAAEIFREKMGITVVLGDGPVPFTVQAGYLLALGVLTIAAAVVISRRKSLQDR